MPNSPQIHFDHEATLEELAGVGKNRRFDEFIDDREFEEIQVICRRGGEEIALAKPVERSTLVIAICTTKRRSASPRSRRFAF
jgi:hypothetical protein